MGVVRILLPHSLELRREMANREIPTTPGESGDHLVPLQKRVQLLPEASNLISQPPEALGTRSVVFHNRRLRVCFIFSSTITITYNCFFKYFLAVRWVKCS